MYDHINTVNNQKSHFRFALVLCLCTALWFALGGVIKVWVASSTGKTIEIVVCSGSGIKKIHVSLSGAEQAAPETTFKHCGNAPMALSADEWSTLKHLAYVAPSTANVLRFVQSPSVHTSWLRNGRPPPGRAPPAIFSA